MKSRIAKKKGEDQQTGGRNFTRSRCAFRSSDFFGADRRIMVYNFRDRIARNFDYFAVGAFDLNARSGERLRHLHTADDAAHSATFFRYDFYVIFAVERLQSSDGFGYFHYLTPFFLQSYFATRSVSRGPGPERTSPETRREKRWQKQRARTSAPLQLPEVRARVSFMPLFEGDADNGVAWTLADTLLLKLSAESKLHMNNMQPQRGDGRILAKPRWIRRITQDWQTLCNPNKMPS